ncbi:hypothetical protein DPMN_045636 [Dreissena polymorpha]|uniref:Uncharacterized protein n=1 Tax=Dreissena polymorpha TaxID=45954 RepID=A0A9D4D597_DREPO|nr:hypothetical protein DPMN_045636 [Dreissena polymorpha]
MTTGLSSSRSSSYRPILETLGDMYNGIKKAMGPALETSAHLCLPLARPSTRKKEILSLSSGKAPGKDGIPPGVIECTTDAFDIHSSVLAPTLFGIFSAVKGDYLHTGSDGSDAALVIHTKTELQRLLDRFVKSCYKFSLTDNQP